MFDGFFLFGPRGTGKSTWLHEHFQNADLVIDLLDSKTFLKYQYDPSLLKKEIALLKPNAIVVIDEIQRLGLLLNEVHSILFETRGKVQFILTGSSARKLKRDGANLLAGRVLTRQFFPLLKAELQSDFDLSNALRYGTLPRVIQGEAISDRVDRLDAYVLTYLREEVQQEAFVRNLSAFQRFLEVAALSAGRITNMRAIARDVGASRSRVQGYFQILYDTLLGWNLPAFKMRAKMKEVAHSKFYFFDNGVTRALMNEHRNSPSKSELGHLFELWILNEIRALSAYLNLGAEMAYWRTVSGTKVDLIWYRGKKRIGIEIKYSTKWKPEYCAGLNELLKTEKIERAYGVFIGEQGLRFGKVEVLPFSQFLEQIQSGKIGFD